MEGDGRRWKEMGGDGRRKGWWGVILAVILAPHSPTVPDRTALIVSKSISKPVERPFWGHAEGGLH